MDSARQPADDQSVNTPQKRRTLDELLEEARTRIRRFEPNAAFAAHECGAVIIDIRSDGDRERDGIVPGSIHIPRTVLEWRLDPDSPSRNPHIGGLDQQLLVLCDHGCSSILAAATLVDLGFAHAGDVIGGYAAWREVGLPTGSAPPSPRRPDEAPGMRPPDS